MRENCVSGKPSPRRSSHDKDVENPVNPRLPILVPLEMLDKKALQYAGLLVKPFFALLGLRRVAYFLWQNRPWVGLPVGASDSGGHEEIEQGLGIWRQV